MPKPRRKTTVFTGFSTNNLPSEDAKIPHEVPSGRYSITSSSIVPTDASDQPYQSPMVTSMVEVTLKPIDIMSISWTPDMKPLEEIRQKRLRIPVRPKTLVISSIKNTSHGSTRTLDLSTTMDLTPTISRSQPE